jgi:hypothetical protein
VYSLQIKTQVSHVSVPTVVFVGFWGTKVEGMEVKADEGGVTYTQGGYQWFILPAGCKLSSDHYLDC